MAMTRLTLQNRITTLMAILSIIFIGTFTFIQLNIQISNLNHYNTYQAKLSSLIVRNNLEAAISQTQEPALIATQIQTSMTELVETNIINDAMVFDSKGKIIAATDAFSVGQEAAYRDLNRIPQLQSLRGTNRWLIPEVDPIHQRINIYILIKGAADAGDTFYIAKISSPMGNIQMALMDVYKPIGLTTFLVIVIIMVAGYILSKNVLGPIKVLNNVTKIIAAGDLSIRTRIRTRDELEELGHTFNYMTEELIKMKERAENANPLTKLPGNIVIHEEVEKRIAAKKKFTVIYCDLDNFKAFNDKYGIAKGDEAIKLTADVFKDAIKEKGGSDDFLGHEGGDDFILLTTPERTSGIGDYITREFDKRVRGLYSDEDLKLGYILAHGRDDVLRKFPIMTISLAGVSNESLDISSYAEVTNIAATVKKKAKCLEKSCLVFDKGGR
jgi:GGDEF domain-containing protein